jgi:hypothetical protein
MPAYVGILLEDREVEAIMQKVRTAQSGNPRPDDR